MWYVVVFVCGAMIFSARIYSFLSCSFSLVYFCRRGNIFFAYSFLRLEFSITDFCFIALTFILLYHLNQFCCIFSFASFTMMLTSFQWQLNALDAGISWTTYFLVLFNVAISSAVTMKSYSWYFIWGFSRYLWNCKLQRILQLFLLYYWKQS